VAHTARAAGTTKRVSPHTMRHSLVTHLREDGYDMRTVQELLGHRDVRTTMTYPHVMSRGALESWAYTRAGSTPTWNEHNLASYGSDV